MYTYKNIGWWKGFDNKYYCSISYEPFSTIWEVKKYIKLNKIRFQ